MSYLRLLATARMKFCPIPKNWLWPGMPQKSGLGTQDRHTDRPKFVALHSRVMMTEECVVTDILAPARYAGRNLVPHSACCA